MCGIEDPPPPTFISCQLLPSKMENFPRTFYSLFLNNKILYCFKKELTRFIGRTHVLLFLYLNFYICITLFPHKKETGEQTHALIEWSECCVFFLNFSLKTELALPVHHHCRSHKMQILFEPGIVK